MEYLILALAFTIILVIAFFITLYSLHNLGAKEDDAAVLGGITIILVISAIGAIWMWIWLFENYALKPII